MPNKSNRAATKRSPAGRGLPSPREGARRFNVRVIGKPLARGATGQRGARAAARPDLRPTWATPRRGASGGAIRAFRGGTRPATGGAPRPPVAPGRTAPQRSKLRRPPATRGRMTAPRRGPATRSRLRFGGR